MANVLGELFQDIAEAIRGKTGETGSMKPIEFPEKIAGIVSGIVSGGDSGETGEDSYGNLKFATGYFDTAKTTYLRNYSTMEFTQDTSDSYYHWESSEFVLESDKEYTVTWGGTKYTLTAVSRTISGETWIALGNLWLIGGTQSDYPFCVGYQPSTGKNVVVNTDTSSLMVAVSYTEHNVGRRTVEHGLGEMPDFVMVYYSDIGLDLDVVAEQLPMMAVWGLRSNFLANTRGAFVSPGVTASSSKGIDDSSEKTAGFIYCPDEDTFQVGRSASTAGFYAAAADSTYRWIAIAGMGSNLADAEGVSF